MFFFLVGIAEKLPPSTYYNLKAAVGIKSPWLRSRRRKKWKEDNGQNKETETANKIHHSKDTFCTLASLIIYPRPGAETGFTDLHRMHMSKSKSRLHIYLQGLYWLPPFLSPIITKVGKIPAF